MARFFKKREEAKGLSPGSLVFVGNKKVENVRIRVIDYVFIVERLGEQIEDMEEEVLERAEPAVMEKINSFKREMNFIRKSVMALILSIYPNSNLNTAILFFGA